MFIFAFYLPKQNQKAINPHPENRKGNKKDYRKHKQENKQGSIDRENKTSSKYIDFRQTLEHKMKSVGKAETLCSGLIGLVNIKA